MNIKSLTLIALLLGLPALSFAQKPTNKSRTSSKQTAVQKELAKVAKENCYKTPVPPIDKSFIKN